MKKFLVVLLLTVLAVVLPFIAALQGGHDVSTAETNLPWQIDVDARGSRVFGLRPGESTLGEVREKFGPDLELAIVAVSDEVGTVEGYYSQLSLGFVSAKVIVTVDVPEALISEMKSRPTKVAYMESAARKISLSAADRALLEQRPIKALSVIPTVNLDEATVIQRFGPPGERLVVGEKRVHLLYPDKGLDVIVDGEGKELLQYVAPSNFHWLRDPLKSEEPSSGNAK